ncbi:MAG: Sporulation killing factor maturation protein SkfB [Verrucomicrobia subdivision 3 bacterium]|nr:Sporulation killing factor maturation protein SkfB [Limisphaerales bacterium]MCS1415410.1 Sporulation killing factor maturation protein SkfB [Limisphaerales bacterium]
MLLQLAFRILRTTDLRVLWKFSWNFGVRGMWSVERFKRRLKKGEYFPPFLYISIINSCNLRCQGCWVDVAAPRNSIDLESMNRTIGDAKKHGNVFFGILGGEPFLHPELLDILAAHPDCYFQVFTNGQFITDKVAARLRELGNVTPLISIEGRKVVSDERRGKKDVLNKTLRGLDNALKYKVLTGVATSVCQSNIDDLLTETWLKELIQRGVHYVWFHSYRPVGPEMNTQLGLTQKQLVDVRRFVVEMRAKMPIGIIDAYYDDKGQALCPMASGVSHHVSPRGDIEPCPIIQFSADSIHDQRGAYETIRNSAFLADFRKLSAESTRGCVILERPDLVKSLVEKHGARDTTVRGTAMEELKAMQPRFSQWLPGEEIPEKHWMYRWAKRFWFNDFDAYWRLKAMKPRHQADSDRSESMLDGGSASSHHPRLK